MADSIGQNTGKSNNLRPAWKPGQSGNPGGRPKSAVLRAMLAPHRRTMVATLLRLMRTADKDSTRLEAVKVMLSYLDGKPEGIAPDELPDEELLAIVLRRKAGQQNQ